MVIVRVVITVLFPLDSKLTPPPWWVLHAGNATETAKYYAASQQYDTCLASNNDRVCACAAEAFQVNEWAYQCDGQAAVDVSARVSCETWQYAKCT